MTKIESEKRLEQYWDGALTSIDMSLMFIADGLERYESPFFRRMWIVTACWLLRKADLMGR